MSDELFEIGDTVRLIEFMDDNWHKPEVYLSSKYLVMRAELLGSWRAFNNGDADRRQQLLVKEIYRYLLKAVINGDMGKKGMDADVRNIRIETMIKDRDMSINAATKYIAEMDGLRFDSVSRVYKSWNAKSEASKEKDRKRFMENYKNTFFKELRAENLEL
ncbi:hypothetical protein ACWU4D_15330 [Vibrio sp. WJH972]